MPHVEVPKKSIGGLGLTQATNPNAPVDLPSLRGQAAQLQAPAQQPAAPQGQALQQQAPEQAPGRTINFAPPGRRSFKERFKDDPGGTLGFLFTSVAQGLRGQPVAVQQSSDSRAAASKANADFIDSVFSIVKDGVEFAQDKTQPETEAVRSQITQIVAQMTGDIEGAQNFVNAAFGEGGFDDFTSFAQAEGLGETLASINMTPDTVDATTLAGILNDPNQRETLFTLADNLHLGDAASKTKFVMGQFRNIRGSQQLQNIPGSQGRTALDDIQSLFDEGGGFIGTQEEFLNVIKDLPDPENPDQPFFSAGEIGVLRRNPELIQELSGAKSTETLATEQQTIAGRAGDLGTNVNQLLNEFNAAKEAGAPQSELDIRAAAIQKAVASEEFSFEFDPATGAVSISRGAKTGAAVEKKLQENILANNEGLSRLNNIRSTFDERFQRVGGRFAAAFTSFQEKLADTPFSGLVGTATSAEREFLGNFAEFKRNAIENINLYIKQITGAQMSEPEANRLRRAVPDPGDGIFDGDDPVTFLRKLDSVLGELNAANARAQTALEQGVNPLSLPLEDFLGGEETEESAPITVDEFGRRR